MAGRMLSILANMGKIHVLIVMCRGVQQPQEELESSEPEKLKYFCTPRVSLREGDVV